MPDVKIQITIVPVFYPINFQFLNVLIETDRWFGAKKFLLWAAVEMKHFHNDNKETF